MNFKIIFSIVGLLFIVVIKFHQIFSKIHYWRSGPKNMKGKHCNDYENTTREGVVTSDGTGDSGGAIGSGGITAEIKGKRIRTNGVIPANEKIVICRYCGVENSIPENGGRCRCYFCREII